MDIGFTGLRREGGYRSVREAVPEELRFKTRSDASQKPMTGPRVRGGSCQIREDTFDRQMSAPGANKPFEL